MASTTNGVIGLNVDQVDTGTTTDGENAKWALGHEVEYYTSLTDHGYARYVQAAEAISTTTNEPYALAIDENNQASKATAALGLAGYRFGIAPQQIIPDNAFFWARVRAGAAKMRLTASAAADVVLGIGGVGAAGRLASSVTASAGNMTVLGLVITAAASASASAGNTIRTAFFSHPTFTTAVAD